MIPHETLYAHAVAKGLDDDVKAYYREVRRKRFGDKRYGVYPRDRQETAKALVEKSRRFNKLPQHLPSTPKVDRGVKNPDWRSGGKMANVIAPMNRAQRPQGWTDGPKGQLRRRTRGSQRKFQPPLDKHGKRVNDGSRGTFYKMDDEEIAKAIAGNVAKKFKDRHGILRNEDGTFADVPDQWQRDFAEFEGTVLDNPENRRIAYEQASQLIEADPGYQRERDEQRAQARRERDEQTQTGFLSSEERKGRRKLTDEERKKVYTAAAVVGGMLTIGLLGSRYRKKGVDYRALRKTADAQFGKNKADALMKAGNEFVSVHAKNFDHLDLDDALTARKRLVQALSEAYESGASTAWDDHGGALRKSFTNTATGSRRATKEISGDTFKRMARDFSEVADRFVGRLDNPSRGLPDRYNPLDRDVRAFTRRMRNPAAPGTKEFRAGRRKERVETLRANAPIALTALASATSAREANEDTHVSSTQELRDLSGSTSRARMQQARETETSTEPERVSEPVKTANVSQSPTESGVPEAAVAPKAEAQSGEEAVSEALEQVKANPRTPSERALSNTEGTVDYHEGLVDFGVQNRDGTLNKKPAKEWLDHLDETLEGMTGRKVTDLSGAQYTRQYGEDIAAVRDAFGGFASMNELLAVRREVRRGLGLE